MKTSKEPLRTDLFLTALSTDIYPRAALNVKLSRERREHLVIVGGNASGKTRLLQKIADAATAVKRVVDDSGLYFGPGHPEPVKNAIYRLKNASSSYPTELGIEPILAAFQHDGCALTPLETLHFTSPRRFDVLPCESIKPVEFISDDEIPTLHRYFNQYFAYYKVRQALAHIEGAAAPFAYEEKRLKEIENLFKDWLEWGALQLTFCPNSLSFGLEGERYIVLNPLELSDGERSIFTLLLELYLVSSQYVYLSDIIVNGVILIDDIDLYLDAKNQRRILPFLIKHFPHFQFIVTTANRSLSTTLSSVHVYDLDDQVHIRPVQLHNFRDPLEYYYKLDKTYAIVKQRMERYSYLRSTHKISPDELEELKLLRKYLQSMPKLFERHIESVLSEDGYLSKDPEW